LNSPDSPEDPASQKMRYFSCEIQFSRKIEVHHLTSLISVTKLILIWLRL